MSDTSAYSPLQSKYISTLKEAAMRIDELINESSRRQNGPHFSDRGGKQKMLTVALKNWRKEEQEAAFFPHESP